MYPVSFETSVEECWLRPTRRTNVRRGKHVTPSWVSADALDCWKALRIVFYSSSLMTLSEVGYADYPQVYIATPAVPFVYPCVYDTVEALFVRARGDGRPFFAVSQLEYK